MSINNTTAEMWDALRKKHSPIENNPLTNALNSYAAEAEAEKEDAEMRDALNSYAIGAARTNALNHFVAEAKKEANSKIGSAKEAEDMVIAPRHYNTGNIECIDAIEESMSSVAFKGYLKGNCMKYLWRYDYKGKQVEDLKKAAWYLDKLTKMVIEENK